MYLSICKQICPSSESTEYTEQNDWLRSDDAPHEEEEGEFLPLKSTESEESILEQTYPDLFASPKPYRRRANIVCTLTEASLENNVIERLIYEGMSIARIQTEYGDYALYGEMIKAVRRATEKISLYYGYRIHVGIALETLGPAVFTGVLVADRDVLLVADEPTVLTADPQYREKCTQRIIFVDQPCLMKSLKASMIVGFGDSPILLQVEEVCTTHAFCKIIEGGILTKRMSLIVPAQLDLPTVSEKDYRDLHWAVRKSKDIDIIFASGIRDAQTVKDIKKIVNTRNDAIQVIAKIDNEDAIRNIKEILQVSDGLLLSRNNTRLEQSAGVWVATQNAFIGHCNKKAKPIICSCFLDSMQLSNHPTVTEMSDLYHTIQMGVDCVMFSRSVSLGKYHLLAIKTAIKIITRAEKLHWERNRYEEVCSSEPSRMNCMEACAAGIVYEAHKIAAKAILIPSTHTQKTAIVRRFEPICPLLGVTRKREHAAAMLLTRGIIPILCPEHSTHEWERDVMVSFQYGLQIGGRDMEFFDVDDQILVWFTSHQIDGIANHFRIMDVVFDLNIPPAENRYERKLNEKTKTKKKRIRYDDSAGADDQNRMVKLDIKPKFQKD